MTVSKLGRWLYDTVSGSDAAPTRETVRRFLNVKDMAMLAAQR